VSHRLKVPHEIVVNASAISTLYTSKWLVASVGKKVLSFKIGRDKVLSTPINKAPTEHPIALPLTLSEHSIQLRIASGDRGSI
jgi:hypothetical protein